MFSKQALVLAFFGVASVMATPLGPGPVVTVSICSSSSDCNVSALQESECVNVPAAYNNDVTNFSVGPITSSSFTLTCILYDAADCGSGQSASIQQPSSDSSIESTGMSDILSSYECIRN